MGEMGRRNEVVGMEQGMSRRLIIGIDPGLDGGIAFWYDRLPDGIQAIPMPTFESSKGKKTIRVIDLAAIRNIILSKLAIGVNPFAIIEKVHSFPGQGVASSFTFGEGYGAIQGILVGLRISYCKVTPQKWMKTILAGYDTKGKKKPSVEYVKALHPWINLLPTKRSRKPHDGMADAICIAEYAATLEGGKDAYDSNGEIV